MGDVLWMKCLEGGDFKRYVLEGFKNFNALVYIVLLLEQLFEFSLDQAVSLDQLKQWECQDRLL